MSLATKLRDLRVRRGQSLQQVADGVGVSKAHIWQLERGDSTNPSLDLLRGLADYYKVTVAFLSDESEPRNRHPPSSSIESLTASLTTRLGRQFAPWPRR